MRVRMREARVLRCLGVCYANEQATCKRGGTWPCYANEPATCKRGGTWPGTEQGEAAECNGTQTTSGGGDSES